MAAPLVKVGQKRRAVLQEVVEATVDLEEDQLHLILMKSLKKFKVY